MRRSEIDVAKGVGILLVVLGHSFVMGSYFSRVIYSFHMPLFFFIAGFLFRPEKYTSIFGLLKRLFASYGMPFIIFSVLWYITLKVEARPPFGLMSIYHGRTITPSWFLTCLAVCHLGFFVMQKLIGSSFVPRLVGFATLMIVAWLLLLLPWSVRRFLPLTLGTAAPTALVFFAAGFWMKPCVERLMQKSRVYLVTVFALGILVVFSFALIMRSVDMDVGRVPQPWFFYVTSFSGIVAILSLAMFAVRCNMYEGLLFVGKNSLAIFMVEYFVREIVGCRAFNGDVLGGLGVFALLFALASPVAFVLEKSKSYIQNIMKQ